GHRLIAAARFEANVVALKLVAKVPLVALPHVLEPLEPALVAVQFNACPPPLVSVPPKVAAPSPVAVTIAPLPLVLAVKPTLGNEMLQELIAAARFVASVVVLALFTKVPAVALVQPFVPLFTSVKVNVCALLA